MAALVLAAWVGQLLRWLPRPLIARLDAWSSRKARLSAERRRNGGSAPAPAPLPPTAYKLRHWRD